jgi:hypothetical protein
MYMVLNQLCIASGLLCYKSIQCNKSFIQIIVIQLGFIDIEPIVQLLKFNSNFDDRDYKL